LYQFIVTPKLFCFLTKTSPIIEDEQKLNVTNKKPLLCCWWSWT